MVAQKFPTCLGQEFFSFRELSFVRHGRGRGRLENEPLRRNTVVARGEG